MPHGCAIKGHAALEGVEWKGQGHCIGRFGSSQAACRRQMGSPLPWVKNQCPPVGKHGAQPQESGAYEVAEEKRHPFGTEGA